MKNSSPQKKAIATADVIATYQGKIVLVRRLRSPLGLAFPGGHVDLREKPKQAAMREFTEETGLTLRNVKFFTERKGKRRDPRYSMSKTRVYVGEASGILREEKGFTKVVLMGPRRARALARGRQFVFDHGSILLSFFG